MIKKDLLNNWNLEDEFNKPYFFQIIEFLKEKEFYPKKEDVFRSFYLTDFNNIKVVILGQDPYHGEGEANGLAFSINKGVKLPPSLRNIFKELYNDLNIIREDVDLSDWSKQGVFLLNTILTVEKDKPLSHKDIGWELFTNYVVQLISKELNNVVFILWGNNAIKKEELIDKKKHLVLKSSHPSPFSYNKSFKNSKVFSKTNEYLKNHNKEVIKW